MGSEITCRDLTLRVFEKPIPHLQKYFLTLDMLYALWNRRRNSIPNLTPGTYKIQIGFTGRESTFPRKGYMAKPSKGGGAKPRV